jgi:ribosome biogenesis protein UTP30
MAKDVLIDSHVSERQCEQAIKALLGHELKIQFEKEENELLPGQVQHIWLMVAVKKIYPERRIKPLKMQVFQLANFALIDG